MGNNGLTCLTTNAIKEQLVFNGVELIYFRDWPTITNKILQSTVHNKRKIRQRLDSNERRVEVWIYSGQLDSKRINPTEKKQLILRFININYWAGWLLLKRYNPMTWKELFVNKELRMWIQWRTGSLCEDHFKSFNSVISRNIIVDFQPVQE